LLFLFCFFYCRLLLGVGVVQKVSLAWDELLMDYGEAWWKEDVHVHAIDEKEDARTIELEDKDHEEEEMAEAEAAEKSARKEMGHLPDDATAKPDGYIADMTRGKLAVFQKSAESLKNKKKKRDAATQIAAMVASVEWNEKYAPTPNHSLPPTTPVLAKIGRC